MCRCDWCHREAEHVQVTGDPAHWLIHACQECLEILEAGGDPETDREVAEVEEAVS